MFTESFIFLKISCVNFAAVSNFQLLIAYSSDRVFPFSERKLLIRGKCGKGSPSSGG